MLINWKKLLGSITVGGVIGTIAQYALSHFDPSALGTWGVLLGPIIAAIVGVLSHHSQTTSGSGS